MHADYAACGRILRRGSKSFAAASMLLPAEVRLPATAFYAFCREADDAVDHAGAMAPLALEGLHGRLDRIYEGRPQADPVDRAVAEVVRIHALPRALFDALLDGFAWDAAGRRPRDLEELIAYAARVAASVGVVMTLLMGERRPQVLARACDLGVAMQLTNIARDVGEDAREGRLYLPLSWMREVGLDADEFLAAPRFTPALGKLIERLLCEADRLYLRADGGIASLPAGCRPAIRAARLIYAAIGEELRRTGHNSIDGRAVVPRGRKVALLARSFGALAWRPVPCHEPPLEPVRFLVEAAAGEGHLAAG